MLVEVVHDVDEFLSKIDPSGDLHYELRTAIHRGEVAVVELFLYGIGKSSAIVKCSVVELARWSDEKVVVFGNSNTFENLKAWIRKKEREFRNLAESLGATPGRYEIVRLNG